MNTKKVILNLLVFSTFSSPVMAKMAPIEKWQLQMGVGLYNTHQGTKSSTVAISTAETDSLIQKNKDYFPLFSGSIKRKINTSKGQWYVGPSIYYHNQTFTGDVYQFMLPSLNNYAYTYKSSVVDILLSSDYTFPKSFKSLSCFITTGLGLSHTKSSYAETAKDNIPVRSIRSTRTNSETNFLYELGAGAILPIKKSTDLIIKYVYQNRNTNATSKQSINNNLLSGVKSTLNTHNLVLSIAHKFN